MIYKEWEKGHPGQIAPENAWNASRYNTLRELKDRILKIDVISVIASIGFELKKIKDKIIANGVGL